MSVKPINNTILAIMSVGLGGCAVFDTTHHDCKFNGAPTDQPSGNIHGHGAVILGHRLYVFGGNFAWSSKLALFCCDLVEEEWSAIALDDRGPNCRTVCNAFICNDAFHAWSIEDGNLKMHKLDCLMLEGWIELADRAGVKDIETWNRVQGTFHEERQEGFLHDGSTLFIVDVTRDRSTKAKTKGKLPECVSWQLAAGLDFLVFAGSRHGRVQTYLLDLATMAYNAVHPKDQTAPGGRNAFSLAVIHGRVFILGGKGCYSNFEMLTIKNRTWQSILHKTYDLRPMISSIMSLHNTFELRGEGLLGVMTGQALAVTPNKIIIIGGHVHSFKDFRFVLITAQEI